MDQMKEYTDLLNKLEIPSYLSLPEKDERYIPLQKFIYDRVPAELYRFRQCNELNIDAFYNDHIWVSTAKDMNDDFDGRIYFDVDRIANRIDKLCSADYSVVIEQIGNSQEPPANFGAVMESMGWNWSQFRNKVINEWNSISKQLKDYLIEQLNSCTGVIEELVQSTTKFACFSERIDSSMMWGHYADNSTGFALSYDFREGKLNDCRECDKYQRECKLPMVCTLFPIVYTENRYDSTNFAYFLYVRRILWQVAFKNKMYITNEFLDLFVPNPDEFASTKVALYKSKDWEPEREWRLFCSNSYPTFLNEVHSHIKKKPTALYLGRRISGINEKILTDIAKEKGIKIYKMNIEKNTGRYALIPM